MEREPVVSRTAVAAAVSVLVTVLAACNVTLPGDAAEVLTNVLYALLPIVAWAWAAISARARVTPVAPQHRA